MRAFLSVIAVVSIGLLSSTAEAQCTSNADCKGGRICKAGQCTNPVGCGKDMDCPGDQICRAGACTSPRPAAAPTTPPPLPGESQPPPLPGATPAQPAPPPLPPAQPGAAAAPTGLAAPAPTAPGDPGWALTAGILGSISAVLVLGAGLGAEFQDDDETGTAIGIGATGALVLAVMGPVVVVGSGSARNSSAVDGVPALRVAGWVGYSLALLDALVAIGLAAGDITVPHGVPAALGGLGMLAMVSFSIDAFVARSEALATRRQATGSAPRFTLLPSFTPMRLADGSSTAAFGFSGAF